MSLAVQVMAHQSRSHLADDLAQRLGLVDEGVTWDRVGDPWETGRRAWLTVAEHEADWSMVLQDDVIVCRDLVAGMGQALSHVPDKVIVSPFVGRNQPRGFEPRVTAAVSTAEQVGASWLMTGGLMWGIAICVPTSTVRRMVKWCESASWPNYDKRVGQFYVRRGWRTWYTWPSLVDHRDGPSLLTHIDDRHVPGRTAHRFVGDDRPATGLDWTGPVVEISAQGPKGQRRRRVAA